MTETDSTTLPGAETSGRMPAVIATASGYQIKASMKTAIQRFGDDKFKLTNSLGETAYVLHKDVPHPGDNVKFNGPNGPVTRQVVEIEIVGQNMGAVVNAVNPTKATFANGQSFSDGNLVVGLDDRQVAIAWNNTEHCKNMVTILNHQDAVNIFAVLTSALRKAGLIHG